MWLGFVAALLALHMEIRRRKLEINSPTVIIYMAITGILGAKLWHILDTAAHRPTLDVFRSLGESLTSLGAFLNGLGALSAWFRVGFAWFGGFTAGTATLLYLGRRYRVGMLTM